MPPNHLYPTWCKFIINEVYEYRDIYYRYEEVKYYEEDRN